MWEFDGQNDGLLERLFGAVQTCDVFPPDVGLLCEDGAGESTTELLRVGVLLAVLIVPGILSACHPNLYLIFVYVLATLPAATC